MKSYLLRRLWQSLLVLFGNLFETAKMFVVIMVLALLGWSLTQAVLVLERRLARWKETERAVR